MAHELNAKEMILHNVQIAVRCPANWDEMTGDEKKRFCGQCKLHVHNLSAMTELEAERLLQEARRQEGRLCVRFYRRFDGKILTRDCPVGLRLLVAPATYLFKSVAAMSAFAISIAFGIKAVETAKEQLKVSLSQAFSQCAFTGNVYIPPEK